MYTLVWDVINTDFLKSCLVFVFPGACLSESLVGIVENVCLWKEDEHFQKCGGFCSAGENLQTASLLRGS